MYSIEQVPKRPRENGLSPDYVYRETKRYVDAVEGTSSGLRGGRLRHPLAAGAFSQRPGGCLPGDPAFEAGAKGLGYRLGVSREYDEMRLENLGAVGRALKDARLT